MNSYENEQMSYECDLTAERDRLREINAELVAALMACCESMDKATVYNSYTDPFDKARALLAKARGGMT